MVTVSSRQPPLRGGIRALLTSSPRAGPQLRQKVHQHISWLWRGRGGENGAAQIDERGGGGSGTQKFVSQKWPKSIPPFVNFIVSHDVSWVHGGGVWGPQMVRLQCPHLALAAPAPQLSSPSVQSANVRRSLSSRSVQQFIPRPCVRSLHSLPGLYRVMRASWGLGGGVLPVVLWSSAVLIHPSGRGGGSFKRGPIGPPPPHGGDFPPPKTKRRHKTGDKREHKDMPTTDPEPPTSPQTRVQLAGKGLWTLQLLFCSPPV